MATLFDYVRICLFDNNFANCRAGVGSHSYHIGASCKAADGDGDVVVIVCPVEHFLACHIEDFHSCDLFGSDVDVLSGRVRGKCDFDLVVVVDADIDESDVDVYFNFWMFEIIGIDVQCAGSVAECVVAGKALPVIEIAPKEGWYDWYS